MRYLSILFSTTLITALTYFSLSLLLIPAPIAAEYWVREMIAIKKDLAQQYSGRRKMIVAGGSGVIFNVDTRQLGEDLGVPVLNMGLHAGLALKSILDFAGAAAEPGDTIILIPEPPYYFREEPTHWQARNTMAWNAGEWRSLGLADRIHSVALLAPSILVELAEARLRRAFFPESIAERLKALDDEATLARFGAAPEPTGFAYSAYHLDTLGNMRKTDGALYEDIPPFLPTWKVEMTTEVAETFRRFAEDMARKGVALYFANTPFLANPKLSRKKIAAASAFLAREVAPFGPMLDSYFDVMFERKLFFNTQMHLNAEGRAIRTRRLAEAIRGNPGFMARIGE